MFTKYKDARGRLHDSKASAELADYSHDKETKELNDIGLTRIDLAILVALVIFTLLLGLTFQMAIGSHPDDSAKYFFMHVPLVCASWYGWYLLLKIPVGIRMILYSVVFIVGMGIIIYTGVLV